MVLISNAARISLVCAFLLILSMPVSALRVTVDKNLQNFWDFANEPRQTDGSCECGKFDPNNWSSPWNLYVHIRSQNPPSNKTCLGTIVASNLIVTSHKCLVLTGRRIRIFDMLQPRTRLNSRNIATEEEITVSSSASPSIPAQFLFQVLKIYLNPQFVLSSERKLFPENDLVILKVKANFISHPRYSVVCVPAFDKNLRIGDITGIYYGDSSESVVELGEPPYPHVGFISDKRKCYEHLNIKHLTDSKEMSFNKTLCFHFATQEWHTWVEGGPLIYNPNQDNGQSPGRAFLMGVATLIDSNVGGTGYEASIGQEHAYFSSILHLIKFIEHYAKLEEPKTVWCKTPELTLHKKQFPSQDRTAGITWPWHLTSQQNFRDETLDCECGAPNSKFLAGRIVGGEEVDPKREYGWMAALVLYHEGRQLGANVCGGSIINDRIIMTAAHCVVSDSKINRGEKRVSINPENIDVTINAHLRTNDPEGIKLKVLAVLFHPEYLHAKQAKHSYFESDIALLVLQEKLEFPKDRKGIRPICLPETNSYIPVVGKTATVVGWGYLKPTGGISPTLQQLQIPIINLSECRNLFPTTVKITDSFVCAGTLNRWRDSAGGDSGGPLMILNTASSQWFQVALVSYGLDNPSSDTETAALYTDVQKFLPFVDYHSKRVGAKWCKNKLN